MTAFLRQIQPQKPALSFEVTGKESEMNELRSIKWDGRCAEIIDQKELPERFVLRKLCRLADFEDAIKTMKVRGAPLIGITAAYGLVAHLKGMDLRDWNTFESELEKAVARLQATRPTAVNLFKALARMRRVVDRGETVSRNIDLLEVEAMMIDREEEEMCRLMGKNGAELISVENAKIMTICNTGFLATSGIGTALGVIYTAFEVGKVGTVYALETRPVLQGARLTMWELMQKGIPSYLITDNTAAIVMERIGIDYIFVGADRIAANGDVANKIGTFMLALIARNFNVPFYVVAPSSTIDPECPDGDHIPIEQRDAGEVVNVRGCQIAPRGANALNFAFDVTPSELITGIVTEKGVFKPHEVIKAVSD